jgi:hypothetical protein
MGSTWAAPLLLLSVAVRFSKDGRAESHLRIIAGLQPLHGYGSRRRYRQCCDHASGGIAPNPWKPRRAGWKFCEKAMRYTNERSNTRSR